MEKCPHSDLLPSARSPESAGLWLGQTTADVGGPSCNSQGRCLQTGGGNSPADAGVWTPVIVIREEPRQRIEPLIIPLLLMPSPLWMLRPGLLAFPLEGSAEISGHECLTHSR